MIVVFASAKGGAGKSTISCNIAYHLSKMNYKTLLFDSDVGSSVDYIFFGVYKHFTIKDYLDNHEAEIPKCFDDIKQSINEKLSLISSPNGFVEISMTQLELIKQELINQNEKNDFIIIDTQAGTHIQNLEFMKIADKIYIVVNLDDQSIADNFSLIRDLQKVQFGVTAEIYLITNRISDPKISNVIYENINKLLIKKGCNPIKFAANICKSNNIESSINNKEMFMEKYKHTNVYNQFMAIIDTLIQEKLHG